LTINFANAGSVYINATITYTEYVLCLQISLQILL